jgi:hypothetical protein
MGTQAIGARAPSRVWLCAVLGVWAVAVSGYWSWLAVYSHTPGQLHAPPPLRPVSLSFATAGSRHLVVMAIHPKCPCSRSSIGELGRLLSTFHDTLVCVVLVYQPDAAGNDWLATDLVASVKQLPHTEVVVDVDGREALQLGMTTSGAVILYSPQGILQYWGGITAARGHFGDNLGSDAIAAALCGEPAAHSSQPVYGCRLQSVPIRAKVDMREARCSEWIRR